MGQATSWKSENEETCIVCGDPLNISQILEGINVCDDCEEGMEEVMGEFTNNGEIC